MAPGHDRVLPLAGAWSWSMLRRARALNMPPTTWSPRARSLALFETVADEADSLASANFLFYGLL
jgi:hypothetical protein